MIVLLPAGQTNKTEYLFCCRAMDSLSSDWSGIIEKVFCCGHRYEWTHWNRLAHTAIKRLLIAWNDHLYRLKWSRCAWGFSHRKRAIYNLIVKRETFRSLMDSLFSAHAENSRVMTGCAFDFVARGKWMSVEKGLQTAPKFVLADSLFFGQFKAIYFS